MTPAHVSNAVTLKPMPQEIPATDTQAIDPITLKADVIDHLMPYIDAQTKAIRQYADQTAQNTLKKVVELTSARSVCMHVALGDLPPVKLGKEANPNLGTVLTIMKALKQQGLHDAPWLWGPRGSGKSTIAEQVAESLQLSLVEIPCNEDMTVSSFFGKFIITKGEYEMTNFVKAWTQGGVIFLDEVAALPRTVSLVLNAGLSSGRIHRPTGEVLPKHKDCYVIVADNTNGMGATHEYNGRERQDAAFLDRFVPLYIGYSPEVDAACCPNKSLRAYLQGIRDTADRKKLNVCVSPRAMRRCLMLFQLGLEDDALSMITTGWSDTQVQNSGITKQDLKAAYDKATKKVTDEESEF